MKGRGENATLMSWNALLIGFLGGFFIHEIRDANMEEFLNLR